MAFALSVHASVPMTNTASGLKRAAEVTPDLPFAKSASTHGRTAVALTSSPADVSFYEEFYPSSIPGEDLQPEQTKTGVLHRFASLFKKTIKLVSFI
jgi:hypothetical protein